MLKNNKQRGTGLRLVPTAAAFQACFETTTRPGLEGITLYRWYLAQQYINDPLLINGRKFGVRLWVAVPGVSPLRVYLHRNGLALFSSDAYRPAGAARRQQQQQGGLCRRLRRLLAKLWGPRTATWGWPSACLVCAALVTCLLLHPTSHCYFQSLFTVLLLCRLQWRLLWRRPHHQLRTE